MIRPGPPAIAPGVCPGGVVIHVYSATLPPALLLVRRYGPGVAVEPGAARDRAAAERLADGDFCLVAYDGDTGERFDGAAWGA